MDAQQFAYWLQGFAELHAEPPTPEQWQSIREHLALVFNKVTPALMKRPGDFQISPHLPADWMVPKCSAGDPNANKPIAIC